MRASDFDASVRFYVDGLGFAPRISWGQGDGRAVMLDTGDGNYLEIFAGGAKPAAPAPAQSQGKPAAGAVLHFALRTDDCDGAVARARKAGASVTVEPKDVDIPSTPVTKVRIAFCTGPDGETIEFFQNATT
jgi:catechol 2,3-dioxygenase-like lactoylglutathione lyase family enzyme